MLHFSFVVLASLSLPLLLFFVLSHKGCVGFFKNRRERSETVFVLFVAMISCRKVCYNKLQKNRTDRTHKQILKNDGFFCVFFF